ncbi:MAG: hypothetical protein R3E96_05925 [Planctomycetota bacterium]
MDPPYSTHIEYSDDPDCIGKTFRLRRVSYFEAMEAAFAEADRILRDRRYFAIYVSDSRKKKLAASCRSARSPVGHGTMQRFRPVDHIAVVRGNRKLEKPGFHKAAEEGNFFLRGFNHLLIFKKER